MHIIEKKMGILTLCLSLCMLTGCGSKGTQVVTIQHTPSEKATYRTTEVQTGDVCPQFTLTLKAEGYERKTYGATNEDLQLEHVYLSVGDKVKKGDLLVSFQSDSLEETIASYQEQVTQNELLIEHYSKLMEIDDSVDYSTDITMLKEDTQVAKLYIEEAENKLAGYQIIAEGDGTITEMDEYLQNGYYRPGSKLITEVCSTGNYTATNTENYNFSIGETYQAVSGVATYELQIMDISGQTLIFEPISDMSAVSDADTLTITIQKPQLTNAVYVEAAAVNKVGDGQFVYVLDEAGYRDVVWVTTGDVVDGYLVITSGLSGGEKVTY